MPSRHLRALPKRVAKRVPGRAAFSKRRAARRIARQRRAYENPEAATRVLITGDAGKLGSALAAALQAEYEVVGYDMRASAKEDLSNYPLLLERTMNCDVVVHTAGIPHPKKGSIEDYYRDNVEGSLNVMRAAVKAGVYRFIFFSSVGYYGCNLSGKLLPAYFPIDEDHPLASSSARRMGMLDAYNQGKVLAEELLAYYGSNRAFQAMALRFAPANTKAQQYPMNDDSWKAEPGYRRAALWSNCHPDYVVEATRRAIEAPGECWYEAFNICDKYSPNAVNIKGFLESEYPDVPVRSSLAGDPQPALFTTDKAQRLLGFKPCEDVQ